MRTLGAQWCESDTVLHKMVQSWASVCLDVRLVLQPIRCLQCKPGTNQDISRARTYVPGQGSTTPRVARACMYTQAHTHAHAYSPMPHNPWTSRHMSTFPLDCAHICVHVPSYVYTTTHAAPHHPRLGRGVHVITCPAMSHDVRCPVCPAMS